MGKFRVSPPGPSPLLRAEQRSFRVTVGQLLKSTRYPIPPTGSKLYFLFAFPTFTQFFFRDDASKKSENGKSLENLKIENTRLLRFLIFEDRVRGARGSQK